MKKLRLILFTAAAILAFADVCGQARPFDTPDGMFEIELIEYQSLKPVPTPALHGTTPQKTEKEKGPRQKVHFAWGADVGASVDLSGNDMTTLDVDIALGLRRGWLNFIGVGAQADLAISNSQRNYPIFLLFRTNFTDRPTHCFWELKGGAAVTVADDAERCTGVYASTGIGINLASSSKFRSHITVGYTFLQRSRDILENIAFTDRPDLHYVTIKLGISF